ncbi:hypothetical protein DL96DRAFT_1598002 [Flagelloscypha sp. PMI_526]|nr:hypothetical protein DL96DRAFT_1598002 [Flagelloscypha sp. PMI_526]
MPSSKLSSASSASSATIRPLYQSPPPSQTQPSRRIPVTPAVLRDIFASSRSSYEERSISRIAFFRFVGFLFSCVGISFLAARNRSLAMKSTAALLGAA